MQPAKIEYCIFIHNLLTVVMNSEKKMTFTVAGNWAPLIISREDPHVDPSDEHALRITDAELHAVARRLTRISNVDRTDGDRALLQKLMSVDSIKASCSCSDALFGSRCGVDWCSLQHCGRCIKACTTPRVKKRKRPDEPKKQEPKATPTEKTRTRKQRKVN